MSKFVFKIINAKRFIIIIPSAGVGSGKKCKLSKMVCGRRIGVQMSHDTFWHFLIYKMKIINPCE